MKIAIDCFKLIKGVGKSIGIYNFALDLAHILTLEKQKSDNPVIANAEIVVIANEFNKKEFENIGVKVHVVKSLNPLNKVHCIYWELFGVTLYRRKMNFDRVIFPRGFSSFLFTSKDVVVIHDFIPFYYAENFPHAMSRMENTYVMLRLKYSAKHARRLITISDTSKADILNRVKILDEKIKVIHSGFESLKFEKKQIQKEPYIYANTSALPHKNAIGIINAYTKYCEISKNPCDLVIVGISDAKEYGLPENLRSKVFCYKYIDDNNEMYNLIANSQVFLFLSLIEGFGRPPIEAMQLKVPVICSNTTSLPEVVGNAGILVDPNNASEVAYALDKLIGDENRKKELVDNGIQNIERFSWESRGKLYWEAIIE